MPDLKSTTDEELARQAQTGSMAAFEELVSRFEHRIYAFVANSCRHEMDAREVTQDSFVRAFQGLAGYDPDRPFAAWLFTIARRKCIDHHRAKAPPSVETQPDSADPDDPAELLARREDRQNLWNVARRLLPAAQFEALWLRYAEDMGVAQIAQVLRKTQTNVKVLLFRARQALGRELHALEQPATFVSGPGSVQRLAGKAPAAATGSASPLRQVPERLNLLFAGRKGSL
ncbi:MAG TPA: sigma-70 family RNA polymerase sigma factor [Candidatus Acidoferrum sp.]|nr:sigma-70 family RNA polymerase sigma factor [Candidatus Acidoferrum sp.]